jgi:hypothetical protein
MELYRMAAIIQAVNSSALLPDNLARSRDVLLSRAQRQSDCFCVQM